MTAVGSSALPAWTCNLAVLPCLSSRVTSSGNVCNCGRANARWILAHTTPGQRAFHRSRCPAVIGGGLIDPWAADRRALVEEGKRARGVKSRERVWRVCRNGVIA